jgi:high-affinity Fe2+/Pb2+ permease
MDSRLVLGALVAVAATAVLVWGFRAVVHRAREQGRSVPALMVASVLFSPFLVLLTLRRRR